MRRVVFVNTWTGNYELEIVGLCSIADQHHQLEVTCKTTDEGDSGYKKNFLSLTGHMAYFVEQVASVDVSVNHYRVTFKPQQILPDVDLRGSWNDLTTRREYNSN